MVNNFANLAKKKRRVSNPKKLFGFKEAMNKSEEGGKLFGFFNLRMVKSNQVCKKLKVREIFLRQFILLIMKDSKEEEKLDRSRTFFIVKKKEEIKASLKEQSPRECKKL